MYIKTIAVSPANKHTGKFSVQLDTVQKILAGEINALLVVDRENKDDPVNFGKLLKGPALWQTIGTAISNGFLRADSPCGEGKDVYFVARRP